MFDLHGTLLNSNKAWEDALIEFDPEKKDFYHQAIMDKKNRKELAQIAGVSFETLSERYYSLVKIREEVFSIALELNKNHPCIIVSNAPKFRVERDIKKLRELNLLRVYSGEDGKKPEKDYLERILKEMNWEQAYLIGNDIQEDLSLSNRITSIIFPNKPLAHYLKYGK